MTLEQLGYARYEARRFSLTPRVLELGYSFLSSLTLPELAQPHLRALVEQVRESSSVSVLDGGEIVYVAREPTRRIMTVAIAVGTRFPAHATSMGRVLLAGLDAERLERFFARTTLAQLTPGTVTDETHLRHELEVVRDRGYAIVDQELEEGLRSVAVPIRDPSREVVAAMNLSTHASRSSVETIEQTLLPPLRAAASSVERDLADCRRS